MARTPSNMLPLGTPLPRFELPDPRTGGAVSSESLDRRRGTLVMIICNHCPYVIHVLGQITAVGRDYLPKGLAIVAISANDVASYPADAPEKMAELADREGWSFPYLYDESQAVARAFDAACTPEFYLFDAADRLVYRGQMDDSRPQNDVPVTAKDLRAAIDALLADEPIDPEQKPSLGCNIKWKG
jgi:peroxiredoxin